MIINKKFVFFMLFLSINTIHFTFTDSTVTKQSTMIHATSTSQVDKLLKENQFIVLKFAASWCGPCKAMAPEIVRLAQKYANIIFIEIDIERLPDIANRYGVSRIPTLIYFENGKLIASDVGIERSKVEGRLKALFKLA